MGACWQRMGCFIRECVNGAGADSDAMMNEERSGKVSLGACSLGAWCHRKRATSRNARTSSRIDWPKTEVLSSSSPGRASSDNALERSRGSESIIVEYGQDWVKTCQARIQPEPIEGHTAKADVQVFLLGCCVITDRNERKREIESYTQDEGTLQGEGGLGCLSGKKGVPGTGEGKKKKVGRG